MGFTERARGRLKWSMQKRYLTNPTQAFRKNTFVTKESVLSVEKGRDITDSVCSVNCHTATAVSPLYGAIADGTMHLGNLWIPIEFGEEKEATHRRY